MHRYLLETPATLQQPRRISKHSDAVKRAVTNTDPGERDVGLIAGRQAFGIGHITAAAT